MEQPTVSMKTLMSALLAATIVAGTALVVFILPAEYNIDPTGLGGKLGLTVLAASELGEPVDSARAEAASESSEQLIEITVPAGKGIEYKFFMAQYEKLTYEWLTNGDALYFDLHGEPEGDTTGYFESYAIATLAEMQGSFTAPFSGSHGWYWKNTSGEPVDIQLIVKGQYKVIGLKP